MALEGGKAAWSAFKAHWGWFLFGIALLIIGALYYDHKNNGSLTAKVAGLPIVGKLFACLALFFALSGGGHAARKFIDLTPDAAGVYTTRAVRS